MNKMQKYQVTGWMYDMKKKDELIPLKVAFEAEEIVDRKSQGAVLDLTELIITGKAGETTCNNKVIDNITLWVIGKSGFWKPFECKKFVVWG